MSFDWHAFFARKTHIAANGCIEWSGGKFRSGYGNAWDPQTQKAWKAHRLAYDRLVGKIPEGLLVCHRCDNKPCVNPDHLFLGTVLDNVRDKISKGRDARGETHGSRTKPGYIKRGEDHWSRHHPDRLARGDNNGARRHPERLLRGESNKSSKLTAYDVIGIKQRLATGESDSAIARDYGVNHTTINRIKIGQTWRHVT